MARTLSARVETFPVRGSFVCDSDYALPYLARVAERFGLGDRWAYRRSYSDRAWLGPPGSRRWPPESCATSGG
jgi:hypothetical protein